MILKKHLPLNKYGLEVRLVEEEDAQYILNLRSNPKLARFINPTQNNLDSQIQWIKGYKSRENIGKEYYFIYLKDGIKIGLNRIYNINGKTATSGSWICSPGLSFEIPLITVVIIREIFFELLDLDIDLFDTRKDNLKVIKMHSLLGAHKIYENDLDVFHYLTKSDFQQNKNHFLRYIGIYI